MVVKLFAPGKHLINPLSISVSKNRPGVDTFKQIYHRPDFNTVEKAYQTATNFVSYIHSLIHPEVKKTVLYILEQNPISYNESRKIYSSVFGPTLLDFFNIDDMGETDTKVCVAE